MQTRRGGSVCGPATVALAGPGGSGVTARPSGPRLYKTCHALGTNTYLVLPRLVALGAGDFSYEFGRRSGRQMGTARKRRCEYLHAADAICRPRLFEVSNVADH
jgi:hypothetical protein